MVSENIPAPDQAPPDEPPRPRRPHGARSVPLARALGARQVPADVALTGVTLDSRGVEPGDLWCALPGANAHGAAFAAQAAARGAAAALTDPAGQQRCAEAGLPVIEVDDPRRDTARAAARVYGDPAERLGTIAVTGTNGKTSVTSMLTQVLDALGRPAGVVGTSGTAYRAADGAGHRIGTVRTTPEAPELHGLLARMVEDGVGTASLEVSSHALMLHRVDGVVFDVACFTNLSQDHLDFHGTMEAYYQAKRTLLTPERSRRAVICVDDEWGRRLAREARIPVTTYTTTAGVAADHSVRDLRADGFGSAFTVHGPSGARALRSALPGRPYVANTLAVALLLEAVGISGEEVDRALGEAAVVPGRMEQVAVDPVRGVVDYSHTAAALEQALTTLRAVPGTRRVITVMGAGGDRDRGKRPWMGEVAGRLSDVVIVTDDNPRHEDPAAIRRCVLEGIGPDTGTDVHEQGGRAAAIELAVELAGVGDTILVAGKGAETGQEISGIVHAFDDRLHLRDALHARSTGAPDADGGD